MRETYRKRKLTCGCGRVYVLDSRSKLGHTKARCNSCAVNNRRFKIKEDALIYKGSKCQRCGYDKCKRSLHFHHRDMLTKEFSLSGRHTLNWERIKLELDKCDLLCANCHGEVHDELETSGSSKVERVAYNRDGVGAEPTWRTSD